ncbi:hypothetical protein [Tunturiibacter lichenicola]|uniref:hypothetical protein n=1 Tax=Tunturiibacter lichenicola TaxID=2051959 RepID=UPI0021B4399D|nr:hypothetical protein [Edaphobacter lichenicola]
MADFTIRVELRGNPTVQQYEKLHQEMASLGFLRTVVSDSQKQVNLPHALYYGPSQYDVAAVRNMAVSVAQRVQQDILVFVAETLRWASHGGM